MKKLLYVMVNLLITAALAGAYAVEYFAKRKLGMNRWVVFKIRKAEAAMPIETLRLLAAAAVFMLAAALLIKYIKRRAEYKKIVLLMVIVTVLLVVLYLAFTLFFSQESIRSYYLVLPLIGLANVLQILKTFIAQKTERVFDPKQRYQ